MVSTEFCAHHGKYWEGETTNVTNVCSTVGTSSWDVPQARLPIAFGTVFKHKMRAEHSRCRILDTPVWNKFRKKFCMKKLVQSIWDFLIAWSEELEAYRRHSARRNYYWYDSRLNNVDALGTRRLGCSSINPAQVLYFVYPGKHWNRKFQLVSAIPAQIPLSRQRWLFVWVMLGIFGVIDPLPDKSWIMNSKKANFFYNHCCGWVMVIFFKMFNC